MQESPLLEQIDWFFSSALWTSTFPNTEVKPMSQNTSDHVPLLISIGTEIPKAKIFRFQNFWLDCHGFMSVVENAWAIPCRVRDYAGIISSKLKNTKNALKNWSRNISRFSMWTNRCNMTLNLLDGLEEQKPLLIPEFNFQNIIKRRIANLLHYKRVYWKNRCTIRWVKLGEENTKFFHAAATKSYRRNKIPILTSNDGITYNDHDSKATIIWNTFSKRLGSSDKPTMLFFSR
jgi:hypothetical protein